MDTQELIQHLAGFPEIPDEEWMRSLEERKKKEIQFFDQGRDQKFLDSLDPDTYKDFRGNRGKLYQTVSKSTRYVDRWIQQHSQGKVFLDYGCGPGQNAIKAAQAGARLAIGLDISMVSVQIAGERAQSLGLRNALFIQSDAENTRLPDHCIDTIICSGMLHHVDVASAFPELQRILAPKGRILAYEALAYNPLIQWYRNRTPQRRTQWESAHILSLREVRFAKRFFDIGKIRFWHIASCAGVYVPALLPLLNCVDSVLTRIPFIRLMSWIFTFELLSKG